MSNHSDHPFYGKWIYRNREQQYIKELLRKYKHEKASEELKRKIWNDLQDAKYDGRITVPFKVALRKDPTGTYPEHVEVILDTKV